MLDIKNLCQLLKTGQYKLFFVLVSGYFDNDLNLITRFALSLMFSDESFFIAQQELLVNNNLTNTFETVFKFEDDDTHNGCYITNYYSLCVSTRKGKESFETTIEFRYCSNKIKMRQAMFSSNMPWKPSDDLKPFTFLYLSTLVKINDWKRDGLKCPLANKELTETIKTIKKQINL